MITDSIATASIPMPSSSKDVAKKKRGNRTAKLKQCKLDARREQWLSQVKKKGCKEEDNGSRDLGGQSVHVHHESKKQMENLKIKLGDGQNEEAIHHYSDSDSPSNSPGSQASSMLGSNISGTNFTGSSGGSTSSGSCSGSVTDEEEDDDDDGCLDDWEAVADALAADDKQELDKPKPTLSVEENKSSAQLDLNQELTKQAVVLPKPRQEHVEKVQRAPPNNRAWKADDAFRPQSLPNLSKQLSLPSGRHYGCGGGVWACKNVASAPSSCPICCEDLDLTDSNFLPCACGFRLCLFCHKRILEGDGRCPGCRKPYENEPVRGEATVCGGSVTFRLGRSCSMITRA